MLTTPNHPRLQCIHCGLSNPSFLLQTQQWFWLYPTKLTLQWEWGWEADETEDTKPDWNNFTTKLWCSLLQGWSVNASFLSHLGFDRAYFLTQPLRWTAYNYIGCMSCLLLIYYSQTQIQPRSNFRTWRTSAGEPESQTDPIVKELKHPMSPPHLP